MEINNIPTGWKCPQCGKINAPWKSACNCVIVHEHPGINPDLPVYPTFPVYPYNPYPHKPSWETTC